MKTLYTLSTIVLLGLATSATAQDFINGDLDGTIRAVSDLPDDWQNVSDLDPACHADASFKATPDLTDESGIGSRFGILGTPYSGHSFISGLDAGPDEHHEGIQQTLTGLIPGQYYRIHFYQAVIKQENALDTSGSWAVYKDRKLIDISSLSTSHVAYDSLGTEWDKRSMAFEATSTTHLIKFLPHDDDNVFNDSDEDGYLRMGIDAISLEELLDFELQQDLELSLYPNPSLGDFTVSTDLENYQLTICDAAGRTIFNQMGCSYITRVNIDQRGVFMVMIKTDDQYAVKREVIQ